MDWSNNRLLIELCVLSLLKVLCTVTRPDRGVWLGPSWTLVPSGWLLVKITRKRYSKWLYLLQFQPLKSKRFIGVGTHDFGKTGFFRLLRLLKSSWRPISLKFFMHVINPQRVLIISWVGFRFQGPLFPQKRSPCRSTSALPSNLDF